MKSEDKREFRFLKEYYVLIKEIAKEDALESAGLALAILDYAFTGYEAKFNNKLVQASFDCIKHTIAEDWERMVEEAKDE